MNHPVPWELDDDGLGYGTASILDAEGNAVLVEGYGPENAQQVISLFQRIIRAVNAQESLTIGRRAEG